MKLWQYLEIIHNSRAHVDPGLHANAIRERSIPLNPNDWLIDLSPTANYEGKDDVKTYLKLLGRAMFPSIRNDEVLIEAGRVFLEEEMKQERGVFVLPSDLHSSPHNAFHNPFYLDPSSASQPPKQWTDLDPRGWWYFTSLSPVLMRARCTMDKQGGRLGERFVMTRMTNVTAFRERNPDLRHEFVKTNIRAALLPGVTPPPPNSERFNLLISQLYKTNVHPALRYHFLCVADIEEIEEHLDLMFDSLNFYDMPSAWPESGRPGIIMRGWYPQALEPHEGWEAVDKGRIVFLDGWTKEARKKRAQEIERGRKLVADEDVDLVAEQEAKRARLQRELG
ncbi:hypothetical protein IAT40_001972 [Kwoniella sp. CBS 6097]